MRHRVARRYGGPAGMISGAASARHRGSRHRGSRHRGSRRAYRRCVSKKARTPSATCWKLCSPMISP
jgi:hypothetical protein